MALVQKRQASELNFPRLSAKVEERQKERWRETDRQRERDRETEKKRDRETERQRNRETEIQTETKPAAGYKPNMHTVPPHPPMHSIGKWVGGSIN